MLGFSVHQPIKWEPGLRTAHLDHLLKYLFLGFPEGSQMLKDKDLDAVVFAVENPPRGLTPP